MEAHMKKNFIIALLLLLVVYLFLSNLAWLLFALKRVLLIGGVLFLVGWMLWPRKKNKSCHGCGDSGCCS